MLSIFPAASARFGSIHRDMSGCGLDRFIRSLEKNVAVHADCEFVAGRNLNRWLYIQVTSRDLSAGLAEFLADGASGGLSWRWVRESALAASLGDFERGGEDAREHRKANKAAIVTIYLVPQPSVAVGIEAHHAVEIHRGSVRVIDAAPGDLHAILAVGNAGIILSDQA